MGNHACLEWRRRKLEVVVSVWCIVVDCDILTILEALSMFSGLFS